MKNILYIPLLIWILHACDLPKVCDPEPTGGDTLTAMDSTEFYIPFEFIDRRIIISTKLNGLVDVRLFVDNGCYDLCLTRGFAEKYADTLGISLYPEMPTFITFPGFPYQQSYLGKGNFTYHFGDSILHSHNSSSYFFNNMKIDKFALILGSDDVKNALPDGVDGIIPLKCFSKNGIIKINFREKRFEFPDQVDTLSMAYIYEEKNKMQIVQFPIAFFDSIGNVNTYLFSTIFDLGYPGDFIVSESSRNIKTIKSIASYSKRNVYSLRSDELWFDRIEVGEHRPLLLKNVVLTSVPNFINNIDMLIGNRVISQCDLYFDYKNSRIYLKPLSRDFDMMQFRFSILFGVSIGIVQSDDVTCYRADAISNDDKKADIKLNDIFLKIDDFNLVNIDTDSLRSIWLNKLIPQKTVTVKRGNDTLILHRIRE